MSQHILIQSLGFYGMGLMKELIVVPTLDNHIFQTTSLVDRVHARGMKVAVWTFRNEYDFLKFDYGQDPYSEYEHFWQIGIDGFFTDFPASLDRFLTWKMSNETTTITTITTTTATTMSIETTTTTSTLSTAPSSASKTTSFNILNMFLILLYKMY